MLRNKNKKKKIGKNIEGICIRMPVPIKHLYEKRFSGWMNR